MQRSGRLITPQNIVDDEAAFMTSFEFRAAEMMLNAIVPQLQAIQNALDLQLQVESGFLKRKDMRERFEQFYAKMASELSELKAQAEPNQPTPDVADPGQESE